MARTKEYDRDKALGDAMRVFWEKGYSATSLTDLTDAMGISRSSLYETFRDKETLFEQSMDLYFRQVGRERFLFFAGKMTVREGFSQLFGKVIETCLSASNPHGCFIINTATSLSSLDVRIVAKVEDAIKSMRLQFQELVKHGQATGELSKEKDFQEVAGVILGAVIGMSVMARVGSDKKVLEEMARGAMSALG